MKKHPDAIRIGSLFGLMLLLAICLLGCAPKEPAEIQGTIHLAVTEDLNKTGLFAELFSSFTYETGWQVEPILIGSDSIMEQVKSGAFDALLLNNLALDQALTKQGYASPRLDVLSFNHAVKGMTFSCGYDIRSEYGITILNTSLHPLINEVGATELSDWVVGQVAQGMIGTFGIKEKRGQIFLSAAEGSYG